jgi:uncharacterized membrane protein
MIGALRTGGVGLVGFGIAFVAQVVVWRSMPTHLGAEAFAASLLAYPVLGLLCGVVCAFLIPRTAAWRTVAVLVLANPATYGLLAYVVLGGGSFLGAIVWVWVATAVASSGGCYGVSCLRRDRPAHLCAGCGYNLTGNVSGICPECGRIIHPEPAQRAATAPVQSTSRLLAHFSAALEALILGAVGFAIAALIEGALRTGAMTYVGTGSFLVGPLIVPAVALVAGAVWRVLARNRLPLAVACANPASCAVPYYVREFGEVWAFAVILWLVSASTLVGGYYFAGRFARGKSHQASE